MVRPEARCERGKEGGEVHLTGASFPRRSSIIRTNRLISCASAEFQRDSASFSLWGVDRCTHVHRLATRAIHSSVLHSKAIPTRGMKTASQTKGSR